MRHLFFSVFVLSATLSITSHAGEKEDALIANVVAAYGGDAIASLKNYQIFERYLISAVGQSHSPALTDINHSSNHLIVETQTNKAAVDSWGTNRSGSFQSAIVSDGEKAHAINHQNQTYGDAGSTDPHVFAGGTMRTSDSVLVYELNKAKESATLAEDDHHMGRLHHVITMPFPQSPDLNLYIDAETFLVSKMIRTNPILGNLDYVFSNYKEHNGITFAASTVFSIGGIPNLISTERRLTFNQTLDENIFALPTGLTVEPDRVDASQMAATSLSERSHHVGANGAFTLFVNTSSGTVAAGAYAGLDDRYQHYKTASNNYKPLTHQVVTHHHADHIGGIGDAIKLGAKVVTIDDTVAVIENGIEPRPNRAHFLTMNEKLTLGHDRNRVDIYSVSTIHANHFLLTHVPADKLVFIADHFGSPYASGTPVASQDSVDMLRVIDDLKLDVKRIATAHNKRIFTMQDLRASVAAYQPAICSGNRPVCL